MKTVPLGKGSEVDYLEQVESKPAPVVPPLTEDEAAEVKTLEDKVVAEEKADHKHGKK
jgi:hypothetical protein